MLIMNTARFVVPYGYTMRLTMLRVQTKRCNIKFIVFYFYQSQEYQSFAMYYNRCFGTFVSRNKTCHSL